MDPKIISWCEKIWEQIDEHFTGEGAEDWEQEFTFEIPQGITLEVFTQAFKEACIYEEKSVEYEIKLVSNTAAKNAGKLKVSIFISLVETQQ